MILECPHCVISFESEVLAEYVLENNADWLLNIKYSFAKCIRCSGPLLVQQEMEVDYNTIYWGNAKNLYPQTDFHINPIIPDKLREILVESIQCYRSKAYTATTIMCRRALEGFCILKDAKEKNLALSIKKLRTEGIINEQLFEWANELRLLGNEAAHNIEIVFSATDARDTLDFTIAIFDFTYSFKDKFEKFKNRTQINRDVRN
jgi:hypothetical protein